MKRSLTLACLVLTLASSGCSGLYVPHPATPPAELKANIAAAEQAKQARLK